MSPVSVLISNRELLIEVFLVNKAKVAFRIGHLLVVLPASSH